MPTCMTRPVLWAPTHYGISRGMFYGREGCKGEECVSNHAVSFLHGSSLQVAGWDLFRKVTSRVANFLAHTLLSPGVTDLTGSYRLFKKAALEDIMKDVTSKGACFFWALFFDVLVVRHTEVAPSAFIFMSAYASSICSGLCHVQ